MIYASNPLYVISDRHIPDNKNIVTLYKELVKYILSVSFCPYIVQFMIWIYDIFFSKINTRMNVV